MKQQKFRFDFMKQFAYLCLAAALCIGISGCKGKPGISKKKSDDEKVVVQYKNHFLTDRDIRLMLPTDYSKEDSIERVKNYIADWVKKKAIVDKAEENIDALTMQEIENKMVDYRQDLLINAYNNYLIEKNVTDTLSDSEIRQYYEDHRDSFPLSKDIVRYRAVTVMEEDQKEADRLFNSGKEDDFAELMRTVLFSDLPYTDNDSAWHSVESLVAQYPILNEGGNLSQLKNRRRVKMTGDSTVTFIRVFELKPGGSQAPYEFVKPTIKNLLLNKRKLNLLGDLQNTLYKEALDNNEIKINEN